MIWMSNHRMCLIQHHSYKALVLLRIHAAWVISTENIGSVLHHTNTAATSNIPLLLQMQVCTIWAAQADMGHHLSLWAEALGKWMFAGGIIWTRWYPPINLQAYLSLSPILFYVWNKRLSYQEVDSVVRFVINGSEFRLQRGLWLSSWLP